MKLLQKFILETLVPIINNNYLNEDNDLELISHGIGKLSYDFSERSILDPLSIHYDIFTDCRLYIYYDLFTESFIIIYKEDNVIMNNLHILINVDEKELNPLMAKELKRISIKDFKKRNNESLEK